MSEAERVFLKIGGSLITDKTRPMTARMPILKRLGQEIADALRARPGLQLLVGHGSGSFGHVVGERYRTREGAHGPEGWRGYAATAHAAAQLHHLVWDALWEAGLPVLSVPPSASARCRDGRLLHMETRPIEAALAQGLVPLVYGDVALDELRGGTIVSTEEVFVYLAPHLRPARILLAGQVAGVFTDDPDRDPQAQLIPYLTPEAVRRMHASLGQSHGVDVTGGMGSKMLEMARLVEANPHLRVQVFSGEEPGHVRQALGDPGSRLGTVLTADIPPLQAR